MVDFSPGYWNHRPAWTGLHFDFIDKGDLASFTGTAIAAGTVAQVAGAGGANGVIRLSGAATTANSGYQLQTPANHYAFNYLKGANFITSIKLSDSTLLDGFLFGLVPTGTDIIGTVPTDGVWLQKPINSTGLNLCYGSGSTITTYALPFVFDNNSHTFSVQVNPDIVAGNGQIVVLVDGQTIYDTHIAFNSFSAALNLPPSTTYLALSIAQRTGSAVGTQYFDVDFIRARLGRSAW
jgi:hypothetical protein